MSDLRVFVFSVP